MNAKPKSAVLIEIDPDESAQTHNPQTAPPVPDASIDLAASTSLSVAAQWAARPPSRLGRWFLAAAGALVSFGLSVLVWDFVAGLVARQPILGGIALGLAAILVVLGLAIALREAAGFARLGRLDTIQRLAAGAVASEDLIDARRVTAKVARLYANRPDMEWALQNYQDAESGEFDAQGALILAEHHLMGPLDKAALGEIEAAARRVATVTALVPLALADVVGALTINLRMIRRVAEIYGGRSGALGNWRLTRHVLAHLVATGAVAVGDDLLEPLVGGGLLAKLSRRFGEGLVNGALTARVGLAAMDVCRPLPRLGTKRPKVRSVIGNALGGLFRSQDKQRTEPEG